MPHPKDDSENLTLFSGHERILACLGAFVLTMIIHFWLQGLFEKQIQALSDKFFPGPKIEVAMQGNVNLAVSVCCIVCIPSLIATMLVFGLSHVRGLKLAHAVLIWLAVTIVASVAWGVLASRYRLY